MSLRAVKREEMSYFEVKGGFDIYFLVGSSLVVSSIILRDGEEGVPFIFLFEDSRCFTEG